jgi:hypothetical protein
LQILIWEELEPRVGVVHEESSSYCYPQNKVLLSRKIYLFCSPVKLKARSKKAIKYSRLKRKVSMEELSEFKSRTLKMEQIKPQG